MGQKKLAIVVDSTAGIPEESCEKHNIHVIPLILNWEGKSYLDGVDITPTEFYEKLPSAKEFPSTSQPSAGEFHDVFSKLAENNESIIGIFISSRLSGTVDSARMAAEMMPDYQIDIIDSQTTSMSLGYIAIAMARAIEGGASHQEAVNLAHELIPLTRTLFVVDTLEFLHKGGRIGGATRLFGSMLTIRPVLHLEDGRIETFAKVRTKKKALQHVLQFASEDSSGKGKLHAAIMHAAAPEEAAIFRDKVQEVLNPSDIMLSELSPVLGAHAGPGLVGLAFYNEP